MPVVSDSFLGPSSAAFRLILSTAYSTLPSALSTLSLTVEEPALLTEGLRVITVDLTTELRQQRIGFCRIRKQTNFDRKWARRRLGADCNNSADCADVVGKR